MSKQVDERVVEMRFDSKQFESNVSTTMSTLDKLKQKLHFDGASKGLENVNAAAKNVDMNGLANGIETVRAKFSALEVMGVTALANITNSAVNAGKRMVSALTLEPVKTGFQEYETQINAVQTILANTQSKGSTLDDVNKALDTLNTYADKTIYNFTEMTRNIGTFTAAGVDLQTSVDSIQGIANLAAVSGSTSQQASTAMYQLSQALAAGKVQLMDWNSVVNAGMGGELFQNALIRTSELLGTGAKKAIKAYGSFRESLTKGEWLTTEVLTETLKQLSGAYTEADLINKGFTKEQAKEIAELAKTASDAATKVKTFSQLWDVMKESAQSGWTQTWELIIGDFEEAKALLTPLADFFQNVIGKMSDARNKVLEGALGKQFTKLSETISGITKPIKGAVNAVKDLGDIVDKVIIGNFGNGQERFDALTEAGYNYYRIQNKVNETLRNGFRYTQEQIDAQDKLLGSQNKLTESQNELTGSQSEVIAKLAEMSDEQLKNLGYTEEQIKAIKEVKKEADRLGMPIDEFIENIDNLNGRSLMIESFKNIVKGLGAALNSVKDAWVNVFPPKSMEEKQKGLYNIIAAFHKFSVGFKTLAEEADKEGSTINKLKRTFEGLFTIVKMVSKVVGGPVKIAFKILAKILGMCHVDVLSVTAGIGDAIVAFDKWISSTFNFTEALEWIVSGIQNAIKAIGDWFNALKQSKNLPKDIADGIMNGLGAVWSGITGFISKLGTNIANGFSGISWNAILGFVNGIWDGIKVAGQVMFELGKTILEKFREVLGIHSPSTETYSDGQNYMLGFWNGLQSFASTIWDYIKAFGSKCAEILGSINWGQIFSAGAITSILFTARRISKATESFGHAAENLTAPLQGVNSVLQGTSSILRSVSTVIQDSSKKIKKILNNSAKVVKNFAKVIKSFSKVLNATAFEINTRAIRNLAISIGILVAAIVVLTYFDPAKLWQSVAIIGVLAGVLVLLAIATERMSKSAVTIDKDGAKVSGIGRSLLGIAASLLLVALAVRLIGSMGFDQLAQGIVGLVILGGLITGLIAATKLAGNSKRIDAAGKMILKIGEAMLLLAIVIRILGRMDYEQLAKGIIATIILAGIIVGLIAATRLAGNGKRAEAAGKMIRSVATAMLLMAAVVGILGNMKIETLAKGIIATIFLAGIITGLIAATKLAGNGARTKQAAKMILSVGAAILLMGLTVQILGSINTGSLAKGIIATIFLGGIITGLIAATRLAGNGRRTEAAAKMVLKLSLAIAILAGIAVLLGFVPLANLAKGVIAVAILGGIMALMIASTKGAKKCVANLTVMTVAIGVMALAVAGLSMIKPQKLIPATFCLALVMGMFALMEKCAKSAKGSVLTIAILAVVVAALGGILWLLSGLPAESTIGAAVSLSVLLLAMTGVIKILAKIGPKAFKATAGVIMLLAMAIPLLAFVGVLAVMQNVQIAMNSIIALSALCYAMTGVIFILSKIGTKAFKALAGVLALTAIALPLLAFVGVLYLMQDVKNAINNVIALSILTAAMTGVIAVLSLIGTKAIKALVGVLALTAIALPLLAFVGVLYLMQDVKNAINNVIALSILASVMSLVLIPLAIIGNFIASALLGVLALTAMALPLLAFVGVLYLMQDVKNATENATALSTLLLVMAGVMVILALVGPLAMIGVQAIAALTLLIVGIGALAIAIGALMEACPQLEEFLDKGIPILEKMAYAIGSLVGNLIKGFAETVMSILPNLGLQLSLFMVNVTPFIVGARMVDQQVLAGVGILTASVLALTAANIIEAIGSFLSGGQSFVRLGFELSAFMIAAMPFIAIASTLNPTMLEGVRALAETVIILTAAELLDGLTRWFTGGSSLADFGSQLGPLGDGIKNFSDSVSGIDNATVTAAADAIKTLVDVNNALPKEGGAAGMLFGSGANALSAFSTNLTSLGEGISDFYSEVACIADLTIIERAADATMKIVDVNNALPKEGGAAGMLFGSGASALAYFSKNLTSLGEGICDFYSEVACIADLTVIERAADATMKIVDINNALPKEGGLGALFGGSGASALSGFSDNLYNLGYGIARFYDQVWNLSASKIESAAIATMKIVDINNALPKEGGLGVLFGGSSSTALSNFSTNLTTLGEGINNFYDKAKNINTFDMPYIVEFLNDLIDSSSAIPQNSDNIGKFSKNLKLLGENAKSYVTNISAIASDSLKTAATNITSINEATSKIESGKITTAATAVGKMVDTIKSMSDIDKWTTSGFVDAINNLGNTSVDSLITKFEDRKPDIKEIGKALITEFIAGVQGEAENIKQSGSESVDNFITGADDKKLNAGTEFTVIAGYCIKLLNGTWQSFYDAGKYLVEGFCAGINGNTYKAEASAKAMAKAADEAARKELEEHSPSKKAYEIGDYFGLGFVNALDDYSRKSYMAGSEMANSARRGLSNAISKIDNIIASDIDAQPTIRPVIDLDDIKSGTNSINSMLNSVSSPSVSANVNAINSMMNQRNQNGVNGDVISAINDLRKDLGNIGRPTYNVNGITYDDGSNVSNAVKDLIRAARIERRR